MLLQPRTFQLLQLPDRRPSPGTPPSSAPPPGPSSSQQQRHQHQQQQQQTTSADYSFFEQRLRTHEAAQQLRRARKMLLVHQAGSVKVGEVARYTITYAPGRDRVLPTPPHLHVKVKNTAAIPLRAAWVHGPYALHVAAYPASFNPHRKAEDLEREGAPEYEPMVKAGGWWTAKLAVPEEIRQSGVDLGKTRQPRAGGVGEEGREEDEPQSVTWIIEVASQILFSNSASVGFELLVGRDEKSLDLGFAAVAGHRQGGPGQIKDLQTETGRAEAKKSNYVWTEGVYSKAITLVVEDTETLWDKPALPTRDEVKQQEEGEAAVNEESSSSSRTNELRTKQKKKKIHLVILTHGLHSNIGADMLFLKESIDATVKQARIDAKQRKQTYHDSAQASTNHTDARSPNGQKDASTAPLSGGQEDLENTANDDEDEEQTIVRGFTGNAVKTENGIQYLGKRLAKWVLRMTYPDQPFMPVKKKFSRTITDTFRRESNKAKRDGEPVHQGSSIHHPAHVPESEDRAYQFTSISFVGHSLGGLIQTYAIAYIHKHSPTFFDLIKPVNFVALAAPMLGLSNENPMYVKFALDFGLVGRTGQDLGLTWRPPGFSKSSWNSLIGGRGAGHKDKDPQQPDPSSKPLLRILPTGPAHHVLHKFRNRTLYSNVVNDGIVPLRTSCLLFLDWRGLGKVEKARRENGLLGTMAEWGWAEITGLNASSITPNVLSERYPDSEEEDDNDQHVRDGEGDKVPQPDEDETTEDGKRSTNRISYEDESDSPKTRENSSASLGKADASGEKGVLDGFLNLFRTKSAERGSASPPQSKKTTKALRRGQTIHHDFAGLPEEEDEQEQEGTTSNPTMRPHMPHLHTGQIRPRTATSRQNSSKRNSTTGDNQEDVLAPPTTSIFESAGDILHPPLPSRQWITDPSARKRTIFHDRVYHPEDIPPPPARRTGTILTKPFSSEKLHRFSQSSKRGSEENVSSTAGSSGMKVEEKIARAYHRDLSWRKVLVRLEPDAHNNMIVRRMFANAYGWPVIKHLCDTHFADTYSARTRDEEEPARERAQPLDAPINPATGEEVDGQRDLTIPERTRSETREARDELTDLDASHAGATKGSHSSSGAGASPALYRSDSADWDDTFFEGSDGEDSDAVDDRPLVQRFLHPHPPSSPQKHDAPATQHSDQGLGISAPLPGAHRGLAPGSPTSARRGTAAHGASLEHVSSKPWVDEPEMLASPTSPHGGIAELGLRKDVDKVVTNLKTGSA